MKRLVIASLLTAAVLSAQAEVFTDNARVLRVTPIAENINVPREECSSQWVRDRGPHAVNERWEQPVRQDHQVGGAIVGGLAGGVIGHQVGEGRGKDAATALGVVLGAVAGDRLANRDNRDVYQPPVGRNIERGPREVRQCRTVYDTQSRVTGYRVAYEYRGQEYATTTRNDPGRMLRVRVSVDPIEH